MPWSKSFSYQWHAFLPKRNPWTPESVREKSIRHGHLSMLHLWWARPPLAACRAVLFAAPVDDPTSLPGQFPTEADQGKDDNVPVD